MRRRAFLGGIAGLSLARATAPLYAAAPSRVAILDTHIHLYDPRRPEGIPWPEKEDKILYHPATPERYQALALSQGVVGAIAIECSPRKADNRWVLETAAKAPIIVGTVGDLDPGSPSFALDLEQLNGDPLFLGIRYGNLWGRNLGVAMQNADFVSGVRLLAQTDLIFESANPNAELVAQLRQLSVLVPDLRIVIDHLPNMEPSSDVVVSKRCQEDLRTLAANPKVFVKISEVLQQANGRVPLDEGFYKVQLDDIWELFGEEKVMFGSDWPNSDHLASYAQTTTVTKNYVLRNHANAADKVFWKNSLRAYRWKPRTAEQASLIRSTGSMAVK